MKIARQLAEDKALRDAALALFKADLRFIRDDLDRRGLGERVSDRLGEGARELADDAMDYATAHKGVVAAAATAVVMWFARRPIIHALGEMFEHDEEEAEPDGEAGRSSQAETNGDPE
jgi:hypothetical protein